MKNWFEGSLVVSAHGTQAVSNRRRAAWFAWLAIGWLAYCPTASQASEPTPITHDGIFKQRPAFSPDGRSVCFARHHGDTISLYVQDLESSQEHRLTDRTQPDFDAVWSPDGKQLVFCLVAQTVGQGDLEVYTIGADGSNLAPFSVTEGRLSHEESPAWSPDGSRIAYSSTREGNQELYVANRDGSGLLRLTNDPSLDAHPSWSPDGKRLAFATDRWGDLELALVDAEGGNLVRLTTSEGLDDYPTWSPDGARIAFTSHRDGNFEIYLIDPAGGNATNVTHDPGLDNFPAWCADGRLAFVSDRDGGFEIYLQELARDENSR